MHTELTCAARFLAQTLRLEGDRAQAFASALASSLERRFAGHWHPAAPHRGSGFRALRHSAASGYSDDALARAARAAGVDLNAVLPPDLTLWIDPNEVSVRVGEMGGVFNLPLSGSGGRAAAAAAAAAAVAGEMDDEDMADEALVGRYSGASSPRSLSPRTSPRISHALPILDAHPL